MSSNFQPGQEVVLTTGAKGVLFARTWRVRKRAQPHDEPAWYFLPDARGSVGLVVMSQPREIVESEVTAAGPVRAGSWPPAHYRLGPAERQAVYVAHMQDRELPAVWEPRPDAASSAQ